MRLNRGANWAMAVVATALVAAACGGGDSPAASTATGTASVAVSTATSTAPPSAATTTTSATPAGSPGPSASATPTASATASAATPPPATATAATAQPSPAAQTDAADVARAALPASAQGTIEIATLPLTGPGAGLVAVYSTGQRFEAPGFTHFVALYERSGASWAEVTQAPIDEADFVGPGTLAQVAIDPREIWLALPSGVGAHGSCFTVLRSDGESLSYELFECGESPGTGSIADVANAGSPQVLIDRSDFYVFCYACGVREFDASLYRFAGEALEEIYPYDDLTSAPAGARAALNRVITLADAGLWKQAQAEIAANTAALSSDPDVKWAAAALAVIAEGRRKAVEGATYPLLQLLFYGDYPAILSYLRGFGAAEIFKPGGPLIAGTVAEGSEEALVERIYDYSFRATDIDDKNGTAIFLRAWAIYLETGVIEDAVLDLEEAVAAMPGEQLFKDALALVP